MKRTTLSADQATWLARTIDRNRATFGGLRMMADEPPKTGDDPADEPLGETGKRALEAEREARKAAEQNLNALRSEFDGFKQTLAEAFGKPDAGKGGEDTLAAVQAGLAQLKHEAAVLRLANAHNITDPDDLELLGSARDAEAMSKLAPRLAAKANSEDDSPKPGPRPDLSQGAKGEPSAPETLPGVPRLAAAFEDAITNSN